MASKKKQYVYNTKESLNSIQDYLNDVDRVLSDKGINANSVDKISWSSDAMRKIAVATTAGAGIGGAVIAGTGAAAGGAAVGGATAVAGGVAVEHVTAIGGAAAAGGGALTVPVLIAAIPVLMAATGIIVAILLHAKNKEEKERLMNEFSLYKEAVKKQNDTVREMQSLKEQLDKATDAYKKLYERFKLLSKVNEQLEEYIHKLESDLSTAGVMK